MPWGMMRCSRWCQKSFRRVQLSPLYEVAFLLINDFPYWISKIRLLCRGKIVIQWGWKIKSNDLNFEGILRSYLRMKVCMKQIQRDFPLSQRQSRRWRHLYLGFGHTTYSSSRRIVKSGDLLLLLAKVGIEPPSPNVDLMTFKPLFALKIPTAWITRDFLSH